MSLEIFWSGTYIYLCIQIADHLKTLIEKEVTVISTAGFIVPKEKEDSNVWDTDQLSVLKVAIDILLNTVGN